MKIKNLGTKLSNVGSKALFFVKKHSPEILTVVGITANVACVVTACRATVKAKDVVAEHTREMETVQNASRMRTDLNNGSKLYTEEDERNDKIIIWRNTILDFAKLYLPSTGLFVLGTVSILVGHNILKKRHAALGLAYAGLSQKFTDYRKRVSDKYGDEAEKELFYGIKAETLTVIDPETGEETTVTESIANDTVTDYTYIYGPYKADGSKNYNWVAGEGNIEQNMFWLKSQQAWAQHLLDQKGHLFLNTVVELLGDEETFVGGNVGWTKNKGDEPTKFVDFRPTVVRLIDDDGRPYSAIACDFNVDGEILTKLPFHINNSKEIHHEQK